jgi:GT2 family glycosyltransferase
VTARVRVVVLNHDGGELTLDCLRKLVRTDWPPSHLQIVLVDNASTDGVAARVQAEMPQVRVEESTVNLGFAGGCNLALHELGNCDYAALVNNDVSVDPGWLRPLVACLETDRGLGAACPKIRLAHSYLDVEVRVGDTTRSGWGDRRQLGVRLSGVRVDGDDCARTAHPLTGFWGPEHGHGDEPGFQWTRSDAVLRVPVPDTPARARRCELRLAAPRAGTTVELVSGGQRARHDMGIGPDWYCVVLDGEPFEVINNVGSVLLDDGYGADRGYLERDTGQYDTAEDVFAWCGAAVLLRAGYLADVGLLDERLFLYYEDLELAWRGRERGWRYRYVPDSVVRHVHSATSVEGSALAHYYNERNRLLVLTRHAPPAVVARALVRYPLVTASYARRDILAPWLRGDPRRWESVRRRLRALGGYLRLAPAMLAAREGASHRPAHRLPGCVT